MPPKPKLRCYYPKPATPVKKIKAKLRKPATPVKKIKAKLRQPAAPIKKIKAKLRSQAPNKAYNDLLAGIMARRGKQLPAARDSTMDYYLGKQGTLGNAQKEAALKRIIEKQRKRA